MKKRSRKAARRKSARGAKRNSNKMPLAVIALVMNILLFITPGLGTIVAGKTKTGFLQLTLGLLGAFLSLIIIGIPILLTAWIWGIITGIQLIKKAQ